jgi:hypothetical protein
MIKKLACWMLQIATRRNKERGEKQKARIYASMYGIASLLGVGELCAVMGPWLAAQLREKLLKRLAKERTTNGSSVAK